MPRRAELCAYCGAVAASRDHVPPKCLYPQDWEAGKNQRITVPACESCNNLWSNDEPHFRTVMLMAGEPNDEVHKLWHSKAARSLDELDGKRRARDLFEQMKRVRVDGEERYKIFPGNDPKVVRIVKKIVRGLSHYHHLQTAVEESRVWADIRKYPLDESLPDFGFSGHCDPKIFRYWFEPFMEGEFSSVWRLWFYERTEFIAAVTAG